MSAGLGFSQSSSRGDSDSFGESGNTQAVRQRAANEIFGDVGQSRQLIEQFLGQGPTLATNAQGLTPGAASQANQLVTSAANNLFNTQSSTAAQRGGLSPRNTSGIIADAASRAAASVLPTTLGQAQQNAQFNAAQEAGRLPQAVNLFSTIDALLASLTAGSSNQASGSQSASSFGANASGGI